jgi:hypothetical protein
MSTAMRNLVLAQAVSELAALLEYRGQTNEAVILRGEANTLATGRPSRGMAAETQLDRIRGGIHTVMTMQLAPDEQARAEWLALRIQRALSEN